MDGLASRRSKHSPVTLILYLLALALFFEFLISSVATLYLNLASIQLNRANFRQATYPQALLTAEGWYQRAISHSPQDHQALYGLGRSLLILGRNNEAVEWADRGTKLYPADPLMHLLLADAIAGTQNSQAAIAEWERAGAAGVLYGRGYVEEHNGNWSKAAYWYLALAGVTPNSPTPYWRLGVVRRAQGSVPEAIDNLQRAAYLAPNDVAIRHELGLTYMSQGKFLPAIEQFNYVLEVSPRDFWTLTYMASMHMALDRVDEALDYAQQAQSVDTRHPRPHFVLGTMYLKKGASDLAIRELVEAIRLVPVWNSLSPDRIRSAEVVEYYSSLVAAYLAVGQLQDAAVACQKILTLDPSNTFARETLRHIGDGNSP